MSIKYIEPFVIAAQAVFRDFFSEEPVPLKPYLVKREEEKGWELSGIIGIGGDAKGVVVISLSSQTAQRLVSRLVGHMVTNNDADVMDTIGEIINIIAGNAKKGLEQYHLMISLPSIVSGQDHQVAWPAGIPIIGIPFSLSEGEQFMLTVGLQNIIRDDGQDV
jgi:chemotaxis protein CheX